MGSSPVWTTNKRLKLGTAEQANLHLVRIVQSKNRIPTREISTFLENCGGVKRIGTPEMVVQKSYQAHNLMILASTTRPATNRETNSNFFL